VENDIRSVLNGIESASKQLNRVWQEPAPPEENLGPVTENAHEPASAYRTWYPRQPLVVLVVAVAAAAAVVAWLVIRQDGGPSRLPAATGGPALVSEAQLEQLASSAGHPVYWAGPKSGYSYEVTSTSNGRFYVRYLPPGVRAGDPRPNYLVVGTYAQQGAFADLKHAAKQHGSISLGIERGGIAVFATGRPTSVYFSYPSAKYQVEVYSPSGDTARRLVLGGQVLPIPAR